MRAILIPALVVALVAGSAVRAADPVFTDQGPNWTQATRDDFYTRDQGSRMIPLAWLQALKQPDGQPFLDGSLARYGYLPNPANSNGLPVGFAASGAAGVQIVGMTCSACHTRQIMANGQAYRIDGGPAIVDFQSFLTDLDASVGQVLAGDAAFNSFAATVLSSTTPDADDVAALRKDVSAWYQRFHTLMTRALPTPGWGPSRLDAVGMIYNRLSGLDLGPPPSLLITGNIQKADAPVRYPFIWNAPIQDQTQWTGFADNGSDVLALARNLGEVFGVFGVFDPKNDGLIVNFLNNNSANFDGLGALENLVKHIGPPKWPWPVDAALAAQGQAIYLRAQADGGCAGCHGITPGKVRFPGVQTWATPVDNVGTDTHAYDILSWSSKNTGVLKGAFIPFATKPLETTDLAFNILATSVIGSIAEQALRGGASPDPAAVVATGVHSRIQNAQKQAPRLGLNKLPPALRDLQGAFHAPARSAPNPLSELRIQGKLIPDLIAPATPLPPKGAYEARVLQGIWAAAPYLHNGSVPTLAELLKPAAQRVAQFKIGPAYDTDNVGLAADQTQFDYTVTTTDCSHLGSGNSNCGHEFGTQLTDSEKKALLEYLKTL
ncbi:di-heme-cytochrome C peroxidase [Bradyrhizobium sp. dw_78]|uniref:di-heme-cytochrome C peroxidase n=1 Tax=Bradyrhizobium sp. dw_78 TaxID=2719793 RepID=UPI001BD415B5|nr:di-heme-cytochrome C peroxidase [Bradyrhizobium sp. dw_78]